MLCQNPKNEKYTTQKERIASERKFPSIQIASNAACETLVFFLKSTYVKCILNTLVVQYNTQQLQVKY